MSFSLYPNPEDDEYPCEVVEPGSTVSLNCYKCKFRKLYNTILPCYECDAVHSTGRYYYQPKEVTD